MQVGPLGPNVGKRFRGDPGIERDVKLGPEALLGDSHRRCVPAYVGRELCIERGDVEVLDSESLELGATGEVAHRCGFSRA